MTDHEYARKLEELDRLLNDPDVPMDPERVWSLLADLSRHEGPAAGGHEARFAIGVAQTGQPTLSPGRASRQTLPQPG
jgi:hypothetical protein